MSTLIDCEHNKLIVFNCLCVCCQPPIIAMLKAERIAASANAPTTSGRHMLYAWAVSGRRCGVRLADVRAKSSINGTGGAKLVTVPLSAPAHYQQDNEAKDDTLDVVGCAPCIEEGLVVVPLQEKKIITRFVAETLLPTRHGNFRVRAYKHSVGPQGGSRCSQPVKDLSQHHASSASHPCTQVCLQIDGGLTFTEPTAIIAGEVEGCADVSA
jgi:hypothetical protein